MNTWLCDMVDENGRVYCVSFEADSFEDAERVAREKGWILLGRYVCSEECPADVEAMIEKQSTNPTVH